MINEDTETLTWQQQAEIYQTALESALVYQQELEEEVSGLIRSLQSAENECIDLERQIEAIQGQHHQEIRDLASLLRATQEQLRNLEREHEASLHQRDQLISKQAKEIAHISHILQIQQRLLRSRQPDTK
jgi:predicted  nucleic acid-binding Zn-ribbon protein